MNTVLRAISGPLRGTVFRLVDDEVTIGRQPSNHLCIGDVSVSRFHCVITSEGARYRVKDLGSRNGTLINGKAISERFVETGDQLTIGDTVFECVEELTDSPVPPVAVSDQVTVVGAGIMMPEYRDPIGFSEGRMSPGVRTVVAMIAKLGKLLNSTQGAENIELQILEAIGGFVRAERAAAFIRRRGQWAVFGWSKREGACPADFARREIIDYAYKQGKPAIRNAVREDSKSAAAWTTGHLSNCVMAIPLSIRDAVSGVIYLEAAQPFSNDDLDFMATVSNYAAIVLDYSHKIEHLEAENRLIRDEVYPQHRMVGESVQMQEVYRRISRIAPTDATVLIRGETGTGKELAARAIHDNSSRADELFVAINCALLKGDLLESELFGHEKGSFTGAVSQKKGKLEVAQRGTVFLDEVAELPEGSQSMLLRVLQEHTFERLGGTSTIQVDIRVIAATNKDLEDAVRNHKFREDLYYRLNVVSVNMPALRERRDDIGALAHHFLSQAAEKNKRVIQGISAEALAYLRAYDWPGNVRELENAVQHAVIFGGTDQIMPEDLPEPILGRAARYAVSPMGLQESVLSAKRQIVLNALQQANGDYSRAAKALHVHPNNLYRLVRDLDLNPSSKSERGSLE